MRVAWISGIGRSRKRTGTSTRQQLGAVNTVGSAQAMSCRLSSGGRSTAAYEARETGPLPTRPRPHAKNFEAAEVIRRDRPPRHTSVFSADMLTVRSAKSSFNRTSQEQATQARRGPHREAVHYALKFSAAAACWRSPLTPTTYR